MGLNFRKSISILPGVRLNLSKSGVSASFGKKGIRQTISTSGRATTSLGIPGTGVYYTKQTNVKKVGSFLKDKITGKGKKDEKAEDKASKKASIPAEGAAAAGGAAIASNASSNPVSRGVDPNVLEENRNQVEEYEAYVNEIKSVHKQSDGMIDWNKLGSGEIPTNIVKGSQEYKEWEELAEYSQKVLEGDIDTYFEIIDEIRPFDDLLEFGSNFQVGTDRPDLLEVEFAVKSDDIIPKLSLSLSASGQLVEKEIGKGAYYDLMQDYVCSTTIRVARDAFALLPVDTVIVHAVDNILNTATGYEEEMTLLSVKFDRERLMSLNMAMIDPSDALTQFETNMKFKKTAGFEPVSRVIG